MNRFRFQVGLILGLLLAAIACRPSISTEFKLPTPQPYYAIQDAQDWLNPYLIVDQAGVTAICRALAPNERKQIPTEALADFLNHLPQTAWPYGRIVGVQENALRAKGTEKQAADNKLKVEQVLAALKIKISWWPSG